MGGVPVRVQASVYGWRACEGTGKCVWVARLESARWTNYCAHGCHACVDHVSMRVSKCGGECECECGCECEDANPNGRIRFRVRVRMEVAVKP